MTVIDDNIPLPLNLLASADDLRPALDSAFDDKLQWCTPLPGGEGIYCHVTNERGHFILRFEDAYARRHESQQANVLRLCAAFTEGIAAPLAGPEPDILGLAHSLASAPVARSIVYPPQEHVALALLCKHVTVSRHSASVPLRVYLGLWDSTLPRYLHDIATRMSRFGLETALEPELVRITATAFQLRFPRLAHLFVDQCPEGTAEELLAIPEAQWRQHAGTVATSWTEADVLAWADYPADATPTRMRTRFDPRIRDAL